MICQGVIAHETGHFLGLPDLYDTDGSSSGLGAWCLMSYSWGFDSSGYHPPHFSAWCKVQLGWVSPTRLTSAGTYSAPAVEFSPTIFRVDNGFPNQEYLLVENRQSTGFESDFPGRQGGLLIWHIDDTMTSNNNAEGAPGLAGWPGKHYRVALLQADGLYSLEKKSGEGDSKDPWYAGGKSEISSTTTPNTKSYQGGVFRDTGNRIYSISASSNTMQFKLDVGLCKFV